MKSGTKQYTYTVTDEIKCASLNTHYSNIHSKKLRIVAAFKQLRNVNKDKIINGGFLNLDLSPQPQPSPVHTITNGKI
jgi:hypothetical protein